MSLSVNKEAQLINIKMGYNYTVKSNRVDSFTVHLLVCA